MAERWVVVNRFDDEFGEYHRYMPPGHPPVTYVCPPDGMRPLRPRPGDRVAPVERIDLRSVTAEIDREMGEGAAVTAIVGLPEYDLELVAGLRTRYGVPGPAEAVVHRFRDKVVMKEAVAAAGLAVPAVRRLPPGAPHRWPEGTVPGLVAAIGLPCVVKPLSGAAADAVTVCRTPSEVRRAVTELDGRPGECERYLPGPILHVDGLVRGGRAVFVSVSAYVGTCLALRHGEPLGSYWLDPGPEYDELRGFALRCTDALGLADGVFHLEIIRDHDGTPVFLEAGMRPGGGEILFVTRDLCGVDLMGESMRAALGLPMLGRPGDFGAPVGGGFVLVPPASAWARDAGPLGRSLGSVYWEEPARPAGPGADAVEGRVRLRGRCEVDVARAVREVIARCGAGAPAHSGLATTP